MTPIDVIVTIILGIVLCWLLGPGAGVIATTAIMAFLLSPRDD